MLHIGAGVKTLPYTDTGVDTLCYILVQARKPYLTLIQGVWTSYVLMLHTLSYTDIGVDTLCYT